MGTKINLYKQSGTDDGTSVNFNVPRSLTYGLNARANDDGGVTESDNCEYNTLNGLGTLLKSASLVVTPNSYKEGKLYSVIPNTGAGDMSVTRATTATRVNSAGLVELVPYNLLTYSQDFSNVIWVKNEATISSNIATAPNGTTTASKLIENTANDSHHVYQNATANGVNTFSFYAKKGERTFVYAYADSVGQGKCFNLTSGTLGVNIISAPINATIESVGNDWFRCTITVSITSASALRIGLCSADGTFSYLGNGTSGAFIWGGQLNEGTIKDYQKTETRLNIPRLDYSNGNCPSLLVEPQRTNLVLQSSSFDSVAWAKDNVTVTANSNISPDGTQNADTLIGNGINTNHYIYNTVYSVVSGNIYTISTYAKKNTNNFIQLQGFTPAFGVNVWANFDLNNGVVGSFGSATTAKIEDAGNGWYRCSITGQATSTTSTVDILMLVTSATSISGEVNTLSTSVNIWGFQTEQGSYATSYIPTTSASVTRNADVISKTGISSLIGQTEGTLFVDAYVTIKNEDGSPVVGLITINNNVNNIDNCIIVGIDRPTSGVNNKVYTLVQFAGATVSEIFTPTITSGRYKIAFAYKQNDFALYVNGVLIGTDTSGNVPTCSQVLLGERFNSDPFKLADNINAAALWQTRLTNDQLAQLTTI